MKVYGIRNCDTVKKALNWLDGKGISYEFHDFKKLGVEADKLKEWSEKVGWERFLNKNGTTWRKLEPETQASIVTEEEAIKLMQDKTSVIKRPVIEKGDSLLFGFDEKTFETELID